LAITAGLYPALSRAAPNAPDLRVEELRLVSRNQLRDPQMHDPLRGVDAGTPCENLPAGGVFDAFGGVERCTL